MPVQEKSHYPDDGRRSASPSEPTFRIDDDLYTSPSDRDSTQKQKSSADMQFGTPQRDLEWRADIDGLRAQSSGETNFRAQSHLDELFQGWGDGPESSLLSLLSISPTASEGAIKDSDSIRLSTIPNDGQKTSLPLKTKVNDGSLPNRRAQSSW